MDKRICINMDKLPEPIIRRDKYGRFLKKNFAMKGRKYAYIFDYDTAYPRMLSDFERHKRKIERTKRWRRKNKKSLNKYIKRPIGLERKNFEYSEEELKFIKECRSRNISYQSTAAKCNLRFYKGRTIRRGSTIHAVLKWRKKISPKKKELIIIDRSKLC